MNNSNPFLQPASLQEQKTKRWARFKVAVLSIFAFNVLAISPLLIQGCKDKQAATQTDAGTTPTNDVAADTSSKPADTTTNVAPPLPAPAQNPVPPQVAQAPVVAQPPVPAAAADYVVVKGDSFSKIAHDHGITVKALEEANPGLDPAKLQIGKKLQIPGATASVSGGSSSTPVADSGDMYVVKSGDSLFKIAHDHSITVKALRAANDLKTDKIKVGQKLKLPSSSAASVASAAPVETAPPAPAPAAASAPAPVPTAAAGH